MKDDCYSFCGGISYKELDVLVQGGMPNEMFDALASRCFCCVSQRKTNEAGYWALRGEESFDGSGRTHTRQDNAPHAFRLSK